MASPIDVLRAHMEANPEFWVRPFKDALEAERVVADRISGKLQVLPDHPTRLRALAAAIERTHRPPFGEQLATVQGFVYFVRGGDRIKIGFSQLPVEMGRLQALQTGSPVELELVGQRPGTKLTERALHKLFAEDRVHGEWFEISDDLLALAEQADGAA